MSNVTHRSKKEAIRAEIETAIKKFSANGLPSLSAAFRSVLAAHDYNDGALIESTMITALEEFRTFFQWTIQRLHEGLERGQEALQDFWKLMTENPRENFDEVRSIIDNGINDAIDQCIKLRDGPVQVLQSRGFVVTNAQQLDSNIEDLQRLKKTILDNWPLSSRPLPPVNREMIATAKARRARGERGEPIEDLIRRFGGEPTTNT